MNRLRRNLLMIGFGGICRGIVCEGACRGSYRGTTSEEPVEESAEEPAQDDEPQEVSAPTPPTANKLTYTGEVQVLVTDEGWLYSLDGENYSAEPPPPSMLRNTPCISSLQMASTFSLRP